MQHKHYAADAPTKVVHLEQGCLLSVLASSPNDQSAQVSEKANQGAPKSCLVMIGRQRMMSSQLPESSEVFR